VVRGALISEVPVLLNLVNRTKDPSAGYHANSIENVFGMARSMVMIIAKVRPTLYSPPGSCLPCHRSARFSVEEYENVQS